MTSTVRIPPYHYIHVQNRDDNVTRLEIGPQIFIKRENESVVQAAPEKMITLSPMQYIEIKDPVLLDKDGKPVRNSFGEVSVHHGDHEYRFYEQYSTPFPLYPNECIVEEQQAFTIVGDNKALKICARRPFTDSAGVDRLPGDCWTQVGLSTYYPSINEEIEYMIDAQVIKVGQALRLRATQNLVDRNDNKRVANEEWLVKTVGSYLPGAYEDVVSLVTPLIMTEERSLMLKAKRSYTDVYGKQRSAGSMWLVTCAQASAHILDVDEEFVSQPSVIILKTMQYCYVKNPYNRTTQTNEMGVREVRRGPLQFFLYPNELLDGNVRDVYILTKKDGLVVQAQEAFKDGSGVARRAGDRWMEYGPQGYFPPVQVNVIDQVSETALDKDEGIYVRDKTTGEKRAVIGQNYMLKANEARFSIDLPQMTMNLLREENPNIDCNKLVSYSCPFNACVQVFNYRCKTARTIWGPQLVQLGPDETVTVNILSGGKPKMPGVIKSLYIALGPDFTSDLLEVETSDHCRMHIALSYNWTFNIERNEEGGRKVFAIKDFIGDMCTVMASKIRSLVAGKTFDDFHKSSAKLIRTAIFGADENGSIYDKFVMASNGLEVTNVDIKSIEPIDQKTRDALKQTVSLAIECVTQQVEDQALRTANLNKQEAEGKLAQMKIKHATDAETAMIELLKLQAKSRTIKETGEANAMAEAHRTANEINSVGKVDLGKLNVEAWEKMAEANHDRQV